MSNTLFPDAVVAPPDCYDEVVENMENARGNGVPEIDQMTPINLAENMVEGTGMEAPIIDIEKSIKIWRERNNIIGRMNMTVRINYTLPDGTEDSVIISGDTVEEIREKADVEVSSRNATDPWSEVLSE